VTSSNEAGFFKVLPRNEGAALCDARELHGYTPWYFNLAGVEYAHAWKYLMNTQKQNHIPKSDYLKLLKIYTNHRRLDIAYAPENMEKWNMGG